MFMYFINVCVVLFREKKRYEKGNRIKDNTKF